ncbi:MAG: META domain-containing protein [Pseudomonadota bacterium]
MKGYHLAVALLISPGLSPAMADPLPGTEWKPVEIESQAFEPLAETFLRFEGDGRYFGKGGCNTIRGTFVTNGTSILFGPAAATMMACPDEIMQQERAFMAALSSARFFSRDGTKLDFSTVSGDVALRLQRRDAD